MKSWVNYWVKRKKWIAKGVEINGKASQRKLHKTVHVCLCVCTHARTCVVIAARSHVEPSGSTVTLSVAWGGADLPSLHFSSLVTLRLAPTPTVRVLWCLLGSIQNTIESNCRCHCFVNTEPKLDQISSQNCFNMKWAIISQCEYFM